jgi:FdhD protein
MASKVSSRQVKQYSIRRTRGESTVRLTDTVAVEEPLEIRILHWFKDVPKAESLAVTMRTPGDDLELVAGNLFSESIISGKADLLKIQALGDASSSNEYLAELARHVDVEQWRLSRASFVNSSCGLCGKRGIEALPALPALETGKLEISARAVGQLPGLLAERQKSFVETGGLHAAARFDAAGHMQACYEDVGRHNALDKLIGDAFLKGQLPWLNQMIFMSSRGSFELVLKSIAAGCPVLATVGAPSSLAIDAARARQMTLIGFVRGDHFNVYSGEWRVRS